MPALFPDVALLHVHRADRFGNCQIDGYTHMDPDIASAATTVLVQAEEIVDDDRIKREPDRTVIPGFVVDAVVEAPFGAYPGRVLRPVRDRLRPLRRLRRGAGREPARRRARVYGPVRRWAGDQEAYLALFGPETLARQQAAARELVGG